MKWNRTLSLGIVVIAQFCVSASAAAPLDAIQDRLEQLYARYLALPAEGDDIEELVEFDREIRETIAEIRRQPSIGETQKLWDEK